MRVLLSPALAIAFVGVASRASADPIIAPPELVVADTPSSVATGYNLVPIEVSGGAPLRYRELKNSPELPSVTCADASLLAPTWSLPPGVLVPFSSSKTSLACSVQLRGQEQTISIPIQPPAPGAYANAPPRVLSSDHSVPLRVQLLDKENRVRAPHTVTVRSSAGDPKIGNAGTIELRLPKSNAPRMVAVAFSADGQLGALFIPVTGVTKLPVKTRVGADVLIRIGGTQFGPISVTRRRFKTQIQVGPGVRRAVIRATSRSGQVREQLADLGTPSGAAVTAMFAHQELGAGNNAQLLVAYSSADGRPAPVDSEIVVRAERGEIIGEGRARSAGVWIFDYRAPEVAGPDSVRISTRNAGEATAQLRIVAGTAARVALGPTTTPYRPASKVKVAVELRDQYGNAPSAREVSALIGDKPASLKPVGKGWELSGVVPKRLPVDGLMVTITSGDFSHSELLPVEAGEPSHVQVDTRVHGRRAILRVTAKDQFGNPTSSRGLKLEASGASIVPDSTGTELRAVVLADTTTRSSRVKVAFAGQQLHAQRLEFEPPESAILLGGWASAGYGTNLGDLEYPRLGVGASLRRGVGRFDVALYTGVEASRASGSQSLSLLGQEQMVERVVSWVGVPLLLRVRIPISARIGAHVSGGIAVWHAKSEVIPDFQSPDVYTETLMSLRAGLGLDAKVGPGWITIGGDYDDGRLNRGGVRGRLGGASLIAGYQWSLADLGSL